MRLLDEDRNQAVMGLTLLLTPAEARELASKLSGLLEADWDGNHFHVNDASYERELTVAIYTKENLTSFDDRSRELIGDSAE